MTIVVNRHQTPHYDVYIGRPTKWGNPFSHLHGTIAKYRVATREIALQKYEEYLLTRPDLIEAAKLELKDKVLGCWCKPLSCHGDILARIANECE